VKQNGEISLRYSRPNDLHRLAQLEQAAFPEDFFATQLLEELLTQDRATVLVAEKQGALVGAVYLLWKRHGLNAYGKVFSLAVAPSAQGQGLGLGLMKAAEDEARRRTVARLTLEVRQTNQKALQLYKKLGYQRAGRLKGFYPDRTDGIRFAKNLNLDDSAFPPDWRNPQKQSLWALLPQLQNRGSQSPENPILPDSRDPLELGLWAQQQGLEVRLISNLAKPLEPNSTSTENRHSTQQTQAYAGDMGWAGYGFGLADLQVGWSRGFLLLLYFSHKAGVRASWWALGDLGSFVKLVPLERQQVNLLEFSVEQFADWTKPKVKTGRALLSISTSVGLGAL